MLIRGTQIEQMLQRYIYLCIFWNPTKNIENIFTLSWFIEKKFE